MSQGYNGWSNRETWLVNVWFNPESREDVAMAKDTLEAEVERLPDFLRDFVTVDQVDWEELASHFAEEEEEQE